MEHNRLWKKNNTENTQENTVNTGKNMSHMYCSSSYNREEYILIIKEETKRNERIKMVEINCSKNVTVNSIYDDTTTVTQINRFRLVQGGRSTCKREFRATEASGKEKSERAPNTKWFHNNKIPTQPLDLRVTHTTQYAYYGGQDNKLNHILSQRHKMPFRF